MIKKSSLFIFLILLFSTSSSLAVSDTQLAKSATGVNISIYRLFNTVTGEHLYTTSEVEVKSLTKTKTWNDEKIGWYAPRNTNNTSKGVYRLFSLITGAHLYTTDKNEAQTLINSRTWTADFDGKPIFYSQGNVPVYRLYCKTTKIHLLTTDVNEYKRLSKDKENWDAEGVALYGTSKTFEQPYPLGPYTIANTDSDYAIQADVNFSGSGTGYHAKILAQTPTSAVSFGPQFDIDGMGEYQNEIAFIIENIESNNPGGQSYTRTGFGQDNKWYRLLLTYKFDGTVKAYINGNLVKSVHNNNLANHHVILSVEGSARKNGDSINAIFDNIKLKNMNYDPETWWNCYPVPTNTGMKIDASQFHTLNRVTIKGSIKNLTNKDDWDSAYNSVSGVAQFATY